MFVLTTLIATSWASPVSSGRFDRAQSEAEVEQVCSAAVEEATAHFSWVMRPLARPRLAALTTACPGYDIRIDGDAFRIQCDGKPPFEWTIGRTGSWTNDEGEAFTVTLTRLDRALNLQFEGAKGSKRFTYRFGPTDLRVTQQISSEQLPAPMTWTLAYSRRSAAP